MYIHEKEGIYTIEDFLQIMRKLRAPDGCPWDREQTHKSIRRDFLEECYEAVEAIDSDDTELLREELGDVLMQVVFHSIMEEEKGGFNFNDVVNDVANKMVVRHPHVFGDIIVNNVDELLTNWDNIKKETKGQKSDKEMLLSVTPAMPALMRNQKIQKKSKKLGVTSFQNPKKALIELIDGEINEENIGKMLSAVVSLALENGVDSEKSLFDETNRFIGINFQ